MRPLSFCISILVISAAGWPTADVDTDHKLEKPVIAYLDTLKLQAPAAVKAIIERKCYDCHAEGGEEKAMKDLLWDELPSLHPEDQMYLLDDIVESIEENEMPPEEHLKKHPEGKLTRQEARMLIQWATALADKLDQGK